MSKIGFIGVGNMGARWRGPHSAGHSLKVRSFGRGRELFGSVRRGARGLVQDASKGVDYVVTTLPVGGNVKDVFLGDGVIGSADPHRLHRQFDHRC